MTDETENGEDRSQGGITGAIRRVLEALAEAEREGGFDSSGRISSDHFTTEYGFSGQVGGPRNSSDSDSTGPRRSLDSPSDSPEASDDYRIDIRQMDDELLIVADLPDVEPEEIEAAVSEEQDEFVVRVGNTTVERMELPWPAADVRGQFQHGVLELRFLREVSE